VRAVAPPATRLLGVRADRPAPCRSTAGASSAGAIWTLVLKSPDKQSIPRLALLGEVQQANTAMFRAFLLKEEPRLLYALKDPELARAHLDAWLTWASRSRDCSLPCSA
jgi:hypothetical protein